MSEKRCDNKGRLLKDGEYQEKDGCYTYRYMDNQGKRRVIRSWRLTNADLTPSGKKNKPSLREQEQNLQEEISKGIYSDSETICEFVDRYIATKTGVTHNTRAGCYYSQSSTPHAQFTPACAGSPARLRVLELLMWVEFLLHRLHRHRDTVSYVQARRSCITIPMHCE